MRQSTRSGQRSPLTGSMICASEPVLKPVARMIPVSSVNHSAPSGPVAITLKTSRKPDVGTSYWVITPDVVILSRRGGRSSSKSVGSRNHTAPYGPTVLVAATLDEPYHATMPDVVI